MRSAIAALALAVVLLASGCVAPGVGTSPDELTRTTESTRTDERPAAETQKPFFAFANERSEPIRVTVYVVDGEVENYTYVRPNGSTVTTAPRGAPGERPDEYTDLRPANDVFWSGTYVVEPGSSLVVRFRQVPESATLMSLEVHSTTADGVLVEHGGSHTSEQCLISIESEDGSRSMGGCSYDYRDHVGGNDTTVETVALNQSASG